MNYYHQKGSFSRIEEVAANLSYSVVLVLSRKYITRLVCGMCVIIIDEFREHNCQGNIKLIYHLSDPPRTIENNTALKRSDRALVSIFISSKSNILD